MVSRKLLEINRKNTVEHKIIVINCMACRVHSRISFKRSLFLAPFFVVLFLRNLTIYFSYSDCFTGSLYQYLFLAHIISFRRIHKHIYFCFLLLSDFILSFTCSILISFFSSFFSPSISPYLSSFYFV